MKKIICLNLLAMAIFVSTMVFGQATVKHLSQIEDGDKYETYADVEGFVLIDNTSAEPVQHNPVRADYTVPEGWPVEYSGNSSRGGTYGNLDDDPELELIYNIGSVTHALNPDGSAVDGWPVNTASSGEYGAPAYGDINGDGYDDVVVSTRQPGTGNTGRVYAFNRDGTLLAGFPIFASGGCTRTPVLADLDLDGALEIIIELRDYPDGYVCVYNGDGSIREGWPQIMDYIPASAVAVGDINGDEIPEIVAESYYKVWAFDADGNVLEGFPYEPGANRVFSYSTPVLADMDNDGYREILVGDHSSTSGNGAVHIIKNDGTSLDGWPQYTSYWIYGPAAVADINGDESLDVAIGDQVLSGSAANMIYAWDNEGVYLDGFPIGPIWAINSQVVIADLDGDEMMELCFDDNTGNNILNGYNSDGTLMTGWPLELEGSTFFTNPMALDADGDFKTDLSHTASGETGTLLYLWESEVPYVHEMAPLPMLQYNVRHSGVYGDVNNPVVSFGEDEEIIDHEIICLPNPCSIETTILFKSATPRAGTIKVFSQAGTLVEEFEMETGRLKIDVRNFANGFYLLQFIPETGRHQYTKMIKI